MTDWISVEDRLPPITEALKDVNFHGEVDAWFPQFYKHNCRRTALWISDEGQRWMVNAGGEYAASREAPTHWRPYPDPPETVQTIPAQKEEK